MSDAVEPRLDTWARDGLSVLWKRREGTIQLVVQEFRDGKHFADRMTISRNDSLESEAIMDRTLMLLTVLCQYINMQGCMDSVSMLVESMMAWVPQVQVPADEHKAVLVAVQHALDTDVVYNMPDDTFVCMSPPFTQSVHTREDMVDEGVITPNACFR